MNVMSRYSKVGMRNETAYSPTVVYWGVSASTESSQINVTIAYFRRRREITNRRRHLAALTLVGIFRISEGSGKHCNH